MAKAQEARSASATRARNQAQGILDRYLKRLADFRVLDPACGSGNFLYVALRALKDLEHKAQVEAEALGLPRGFPQIGPEVVKGIELNPYAAELARVSIWIGEIQWMLKNGFAASQNPVLKPLDNIECRDALLAPTGEASIWPEATVIVGNPPFLGNKKMIRILGSEYVGKLRDAYSDQVSAGVDLVMYWFDKAGELLADAQIEAAGLVATQAVRRGANRKILDRVISRGRISNAWSDEKWTVEGAAVRVSLVCFKSSADGGTYLDGVPVDSIASDLSASQEKSRPSTLPENRGTCFQGTISGGPFEIDGDLARSWLLARGNPNGRSNADVVRPWRNGDDITGRTSDTWIVLFSDDLTEDAASLYQDPFEHLKKAWRVENHRRESNGDKPLRDGEPRSKARWWLLQRSRPKLWRAVDGLSRYIATSRVGKHRVFVWLDASVIPDTRLVVVAKDCATTFGVLQSHHHTLWSLRYGAKHGVGNDPEYVHTQTYETFPFPDCAIPNRPLANNPSAIAIGVAAQRLNELRETWLNPTDLTERLPEVVSGFPDRITPIDSDAAVLLKSRTLTDLYNERPAWLDNAHRALDAAVADAYGWPSDLSDEEILSRLFELNQRRAAVPLGT